MKKLPKLLKKYFWDIDFEKLDANKNSFLLIKRVLDRGKTTDIKWLISHYGTEKIKDVVTTTRDLSRPTGNFWRLIFGLSPDQVPCLQKPYSPIHFGQSS
ncbi:hypothetical protein A3A76_05010 [Candidatus Woesebacteria bacterium RIFCSPLOWO2_01_FULL_39_23]|uniref:DUF6922 domain-containing protein n=2 Tax=Microgenomates group TaxID=1794810 RepID=A0A0H4T778_9BACT|nr:hypothetical protein [uncultured Microgenomates bacterium Rifle_16ft_4_minimus_37633]OGM13843.1 MAG: hypothetical protein A2141_04235 [Candidatus Woesebacteria bacterium RBG_16_40_11]OGM27793.1 MAG: hypothetical protein A2628_05230 [Candidatus Woesebacteria bacterium RIFCSPHIGHO2_01_FULL_40_22]OGM36196.1 MAG: hypothetical protein A3E41_00780 [Candidatus Woesebacteria bacterium RIFCSPHIGHO2_12_FULL_38_9]OGM62215.1 MAG: hypothetical protein A3A76_05010 [Candidatus Woesebacteria bacterium RIFCS